MEVKLLGPPQAYVTPGVVEFPEMVTVVVAQVSVPPVAVTLGGVMLGVTVAVAVAVQLLAGFRTVTV